MKPHVAVSLLLAAAVLSACFMSEVPRVVTGQMLGDGPVAFCMPEDPPCQIGNPSEDGYVVAAEAEDEEDLTVRFERLTEVDGVPVYLGEIELKEDDESAWSYVVARPVIGTFEGAPMFDIAMPGCGDMDRALDAEFGIVRADAYACTVTDITAFRAYLIEHYSARFADPDWWADAD